MIPVVQLETLERIARLAGQVRAAQRTYARTQDQVVRLAATVLEGQLDVALAEWAAQRGDA